MDTVTTKETVIRATGDVGPASSGEYDDEPTLDWLIAGGESGPHARPMDPAWVLSLRDQCRLAELLDEGREVAFFFKQWADPVHVALKAAIEVPTHRHLWTPSDGIDFVPRLCSRVFGDGRALLALAALNTRPCFYVIRIDSSWEVDDHGTPEGAPDLWDHLDDIYDALEDDFGSRYGEDDDGNEVEREWPALDLDSGTSWWRIDWPKLRGFAFSPHAFARCNVFSGYPEVRRIEFRYLDLPAELPRARRMSFFLTTPQILARTKTVTRRAVTTWPELRAGDRVVAIEKGQGLKAGEEHHVLALLEVVGVRVESLADISAEDCAREGFPDKTPNEFVEFYMREGKGQRRRGGADAGA